MEAKLPRERPRRNAVEARQAAAAELFAEALAERAAGTCQLSGGSMRPILRHGDHLHLEPTPKKLSTTRRVNQGGLRAPGQPTNSTGRAVTYIPHKPLALTAG
ncbi:MAG: hypothetical protein AAGM22_10635, partial [Acidobacteriota bacterium]